MKPVLHSQAKTFGLPALAAIAVLLGIAIGLYIVRKTTPAPLEPGDPLTAATPTTEIVLADPKPLAPPPPTPEPVKEEAKVEPKVDLAALSALEVLAPLQAPTPTLPQPILRSAERSERAPRPEPRIRTEERPSPKPPVVAVANPDPPAEPKKEEPSYRLVVEGQLGSATRPMAGTGSLKLGESDGMAVSVSYSVSAEGLKATLDCSPWAIAAVNGLSVGKTPIPIDLKDEPVKVELRRPGANPVVIQVAARKAHRE